jgi:hypothetical protein
MTFIKFDGPDDSDSSLFEPEGHSADTSEKIDRARFPLHGTTRLN